MLDGTKFSFTRLFIIETRRTYSRKSKILTVDTTRAYLQMFRKLSKRKQSCIPYYTSWISNAFTYAMQK